MSTRIAYRPLLNQEDAYTTRMAQALSSFDTVEDMPRPISVVKSPWHFRRYDILREPIDVRRFRSTRVREECDGEVAQARRDDSRVTLLGAFSDRISLGEPRRPLNALQGTMSTAGPYRLVPIIEADMESKASISRGSESNMVM